MANNIINAVFGSGICAVTTSAFRANYGMKLRFSGIELPTAFEVDFSNYDVMGRDSITMIGQNNEVQIPDDLWDSGLNIYAYVYLHPTDNSGVTVYTVTIPVLGRPNRTEETPTPHEQSVIEQAISALNDAVEQTAADVVAADASASAAAQSEANALSYANQASASAGAALASQNAAESAAQHVDEQIDVAAESARNAANSASAAAESASDAQESAEQAEQSAQSISGDVERAESAAATATEKATEAGQSATAAAASASAALASQNAAHASETASAQSASSAASSAQNAASSAQSAESSATDAEQAKTDAQDAQAAAEQAAQSVSGLSEQIAQNTADIAELVLSKAGVLVDTATGSIASFYPDATVPTVRGLTVDIEPRQDLHGYDSPWPAGGGKNKFPVTMSTRTVNGTTFTVLDDGTIRISGTPTAQARATISNVVYSGIGDMVATVNGTTGIRLFCRKKENGTNTYPTLSNGSVLGTDTAIFDQFVLEVNTTFAGTAFDFRIQVESGTTRTDWTPYSNICPISGWDEVKVTRTGNNLSDYRTVRTATINGVTLTNNNDGTLTLNGTATADAFFDLFNTQFGAEPLAERTYTLSGCPNGGGQNSYFLYIRPNYISDYGNGKTFTQAVIGGSLYVKQGQTLNNLIFRPQIELGSSVSDFKPYQGNTYQIQLGQTVYGGTVDAVQGVLTVDRAMVDMGSLVWNYNTTYAFFTSNSIPTRKIGVLNVWSDLFKTMGGSWSGTPAQNALWGNGSNTTLYVQIPPLDNVDDFMALVDGHQLMYELATPITIDLTPIEVAVLTGQTNNLWADSGNVSVDYAADLKTYIDQKIAAAVAALS